MGMTKATVSTFLGRRRKNEIRYIFNFKGAYDRVLLGKISR